MFKNQNERRKREVQGMTRIVKLRINKNGVALLPERLKTLKDIKLKEVNGFWYYGLDDLRAEAIKWIKELEQTPMDYEDDGANGEVKGQIDWIKHFFNIEESELK
jgi:hypothetical protein